MKKRPLLIWVVAIALVLSPVYYYVDQALRARLPLTDPLSVLRTFSYWKIFASIIGIPVGLMVWRVTMAGWWALVGLATYTVIANGFIFLPQASPRAMVQFVLFAGTGLLCVAVFSHRAIRTPHFNPRLRWWEQSVRIPINLQVDVLSEPPIICNTFDLSESGLFLVTERKYEIGQKLELTLQLKDGPVTVPGMVVWLSDGSQRPQGFGFKFDRRSKPIGTLVKALRADLKTSPKKEPTATTQTAA